MGRLLRRSMKKNLAASLGYCPVLGRKCRRSSVYVNGVFLVHRKSLNGGKSSPLSVLKKEQMNTELKSKKSESRSLPSSVRTSNPLPSAQIGCFRKAGAQRFQAELRHLLGGRMNTGFAGISPCQKSPKPKQPK